MLAARLRQNLLAVAGIIGLASFAINVALIGVSPVATFYLPITRAWELLAGATLACGWSQVSQTELASNLRAGIGLALIAVAAAVLDTSHAFPGWWAVLPVLGAALLLSAPHGWACRYLLARPVMVWVGLISYPLYLWHWPLLVFFALIKFAPLTLLDRGLIVGLSFALAWATYRFVEIPFRHRQPSPARLLSLGGGMALVALAGVVVVENRGFDFRLPGEIRGMASVATQSSQWRVHQCLIDLSHETSFADDCVDRGRRPLILVWGDSTAGALMPGLRKAQESRAFGIAQFTSSSCTPALNTDVAGNPNCRAINDKVLSLARQLKPDIVLLHSTWDRYLDGVALTLAALKQQTHARVVVLGSVPWWKRGLSNEVLRHYMLYRQLIPERSARAQPDGSDAKLRDKFVPLGAEFISVRDVMCNADGCLTRIGNAASDISATDQVHLTEKGSVYLIQSIIDRILGGTAGSAAGASQ
jgi:hypothetical protein